MSVGPAPRTRLDERLRVVTRWTRGHGAGGARQRERRDEENPADRMCRIVAATGTDASVTSGDPCR